MALRIVKFVYRYRYVIRVPFCARVRPGCPCVSRLPPVSFYPGTVKNAAAFCTYLLFARVTFAISLFIIQFANFFPKKGTLIEGTLTNPRGCRVDSIVC